MGKSDLVDLETAAAVLEVNSDRLRSLAITIWPVSADRLASWQADPPEWLLEIRRREQAKPGGGAKKPGRSKATKSRGRKAGQERRSRQERDRWVVLECPNGHTFAVKGFGTEASFADDAFYAVKDPWSYCGRCSGGRIYRAGDLERAGLSKYRIGKLPDPDYYEANPVDSHFAPSRIWTERTLKDAGLQLPFESDDHGDNPDIVGT